VVSTLDSKDAKVLKKCFKMNIYSQKSASIQPSFKEPSKFWQPFIYNIGNFYAMVAAVHAKRVLR